MNQERGNGYTLVMSVTVYSVAEALEVFAAKASKLGPGALYDGHRLVGTIAEDGTFYRSRRGKKD